MADISFSCPHCNQHLEADVGMSGSQIPCPSCGKDLVIPVAGMAETSPAKMPGVDPKESPVSAAHSIEEEMHEQPQMGAAQHGHAGGTSARMPILARTPHYAMNFICWIGRISAGLFLRLWVFVWEGVAVRRSYLHLGELAFSSRSIPKKFEDYQNDITAIDLSLSVAGPGQVASAQNGLPARLAAVLKKAVQAIRLATAKDRRNKAFVRLGKALFHAGEDDTPFRQQIDCIRGQIERAHAIKSKASTMQRHQQFIIGACVAVAIATGTCLFRSQSAGESQAKAILHTAANSILVQDNEVSISDLSFEGLRMLQSILLSQAILRNQDEIRRIENLCSAKEDINTAQVRDSCMQAYAVIAAIDGRLDDARKRCDAGQPLVKADRLATVGFMLARVDHIRASEEFFNEAIASVPKDDTIAIIHFGEMAARSGCLDAAKAAMKEVKKRSSPSEDSNFSQPSDNIVLAILDAQAARADADGILESMREIKSASGITEQFAYGNLAVAYAKRGQRQEASVALMDCGARSHSAQRVDRVVLSSMCNVAVELEAVGMHDEAARFVTMATNYAADVNAQRDDTLAEGESTYLAKRGSYSAAVETAKKANNPIRPLLAVSEEALKRRDKQAAVDVLNESFSYLPDSDLKRREALPQLGSLMARAQGAKWAASQAGRLADPVAKASYLLGVAQGLMGDPLIDRLGLCWPL